VFTASIANSGPYESPYRLHFRYYNFAIPLLYIVVAGSIVRGSIFNNRVFRYFVCGCVIILAIYALRTELRPYIPSFVDSPEIRGVHTNSSAFRNIGWLLILGLLIWAISENAGSKFFVFVALPALVMVSSYFVYKEQRQRLYPDSYDFAGIFAKQNLKSEELGKTLVLGAAPAGLFRTLFYLDSVDASFEVVSGNTVIDLSRLPPQKDWFLVVGDYTITPGGIEKFKMNGFQLIRRAHLK
jgi:phosphoglycerol transferase